MASFPFMVAVSSVLFTIILLALPDFKNNKQK